jgi:phosphatidylglycerol:prolipoprotein diacylglycerol transferase
VHPTQLYEMIALVALAWLLRRWRRQRRADAFVLGAYLAIAGAVRFVIEFLRVHEPLIGPFAVAHVLSLIVVVAGLALLRRTPGEIGAKVGDPATRGR